MVAEHLGKPRRHVWLVLPVGRVCSRCLVVLARDEAEPAAECQGGRHQSEARAPFE